MKAFGKFHASDADARWGFAQSSLVLRFVNNDFQENKEPTIGGEKTPASAATTTSTALLYRF